MKKISLGSQEFSLYHAVRQSICMLLWIFKQLSEVWGPNVQNQGLYTPSISQEIKRKGEKELINKKMTGNLSNIKTMPNIAAIEQYLANY